jgi:hypothetical protein
MLYECGIKVIWFAGRKDDFLTGSTGFTGLTKERLKIVFLQKITKVTKDKNGDHAINTDLIYH